LRSIARRGAKSRWIDTGSRISTKVMALQMKHRCKKKICKNETWNRIPRDLSRHGAFTWRLRAGWFLLIWILTPWFKSKHEERFHPPSTWVGVYMYILHILQTKSPIPSGEWPHLQYTVYSYVWTCVHIHCWTCFCAYYLFRGPAVPMDHHSWAAAMRPIFSSKLTRRLHTCRNLCPHSDIDTVQLIVLNRSEGSNICKSRCILHPRWNNVSLLKQIDIIQSSPSLSQQLFLALHTARKNNTSRSETCQT
jgi:hypothetical protein